MVYDGILLALVVGFIRKGNLRGLAQLKLKWGWIFPLLLIVQIITFVYQNDIKLLGKVSESIYMAVYIIGLLFLYLNRHHKGFVIIFIGVFLNFLVMVVNGGRMPVSEEAAAVLDPMYIQALKDGLYAKHVLLTDSTILGFLGDIIPLGPPYPRTQVISIGDVVMNIGAFLFIQYLMLQPNKKIMKTPPFH
ncbi:DUF5317 domain-containing protein [Neobacillus citreus]|uniref:DUF5317 domain-containing protein n=1 Tax=Neobacillus citreus TaxID=2833578 RepID=A0A942YAX6_9BACI|nr:DUF5317 domain-containing protein [Neobacillus citreus]MCH6268575.1 DUF5317 domain-containing protein [Neobacillus citreus]